MNKSQAQAVHDALKLLQAAGAYDVSLQTSTVKIRHRQPGGIRVDKPNTYATFKDLAHFAKHHGLTP